MFSYLAHKTVTSVVGDFLISPDSIIAPRM